MPDVSVETMKPMEKIAITCKGAVNLKLKDLTPLQGNLKELNEDSFEKLKRSILKHGIAFPFFIWQQNGTNWILDGTQRDKVLRKMVEEGFTCPPLPCSTISAKNRKDAAEKILLISSQYGRMNEKSLEEFLAEYELQFLELSGLMELAGIDEKYFLDSEVTPPDEFKQVDENIDTEHKCPKCGYAWSGGQGGKIE